MSISRFSHLSTNHLSTKNRRSLHPIFFIILIPTLWTTCYVLDLSNSPHAAKIVTSAKSLLSSWSPPQSHSWSSYSHGQISFDFDKQNYILNPEDPPAISFRSKLLPNVRYATAFYVAGFNNQFISLQNFLHLISLLKHSPYPTTYVPILPPFHPAHIESHTSNEFIPVSQVFDLDRFSEDTGIPVLEWMDVKDYGTSGKNGEAETLPCWSPWGSAFYNINPSNMAETGQQPVPLYFGSGTLSLLNLDLVHTLLPNSMMTALSPRTPRWIHLGMLAEWLSPPEEPTVEGQGGGTNKIIQGYLNDPKNEEGQEIASHYNKTNFQGMRGEGWMQPEMGKGGVLCFDNLFYAGDSGTMGQKELFVPEDFEATGDGVGIGGPWLGTGSFLHWSPTLIKRMEETVMRVLELPINARVIPPYISIHIRRTDFLPRCRGKPCFTVESYARHLAELLDQDERLKGLPVLVATDETDEGYRKEIEEQGWKLVDHQKLETVGKWGYWWPTLIDSCFMSSGRALVGTAGSTMTVMAGQRLKMWNGGKVVTTQPFDFQERAIE